MAEVTLESLTKRFGQVLAVDRVSLVVCEGSFTSLLGPSGSGKTTLLRLIAGFERVSAGTIRLGGRIVTADPPDRRNIGMVFQSYALFPHMTVADNVGFGLRMRKVDHAETIRRVGEVLELVRLEGLAGRFPSQISGGQQQRVALARAIAIRPSLLLLDEPLSALDRTLRGQMQVELRQLQREVGITTIYVTHDQEEALTLSDRIAVLNDGRVQQYAPPREIYERPANEFVVSFIGAANLLSARIERVDGACLARVDGLDRPILLASVASDADRVRLAIRPEKVQLSAEAGPGGIRARVVNAVYLGTTTHYHLELAGRHPLVAYAQNSTPEEDRFGPGQDVWVSWHPASVVVLSV